jgi:N-acetylglucosamine kinase-like BadF-type ATPase
LCPRSGPDESTTPKPRSDESDAALPCSYDLSDGWAEACWVDPAQWVQTRVDAYLAQHRRTWDELAAVVVGATGVEDHTRGAKIAELLSRTHPDVAWRIVNDAELIVPAAGAREGIGVICGTGSIVVSTTADGDALRVGGWGNLLGDEGSGAALVREALKITLRRDDEGEAPGVLARALVDMSDVATIRDLAFDLCFQRGPTTWGEFAPAVFLAAETGDADATRIITQAGSDLAAQVAQIVRRGAVGGQVILAGSVILRQAGLRDAFTTTLSAQCPELVVRCLEVPPVHGAVNLAIALARSRENRSS